MSTISIPLPDEDLEFLRSFASEQGTTVEQILAAQARTLRLSLQTPPHPEIIAATGIFQEEDDPVAGYRDYLENKHQ